jgi:4-alpha-glucanotransferase
MLCRQDGCRTAPRRDTVDVSSLPSPYGIGDLGRAALTWLDQLRKAGQSWWQALPLGPTGYGNSPYQALSSFAGNELLISPEGLIEDGLLRSSDCEAASFTASAVDYNAVIRSSDGSSKRLGEISAPGPTQNCRPPMSSSAIFTLIGWKIMRCFVR